MLPHTLILSLLWISAVQVTEQRPQELVKQQVTYINETCMQKHCASPYASCTQQPKCNDLLTCIGKCYDQMPRDYSYMSTSTLSCIYTCIFSNADFYFTGWARCMSDHNCFATPPIDDVLCRYPDMVTQSKMFNITDLKGGWWVMRGYNQAMDCLSCQHIFFDGYEYDKTKFVYRPTFEATTMNGSFKLVNGSILVDLVDTKRGEPIELKYYLYGIPFDMKWHVLDGNNDNTTILVYYCGNVLSVWEMEGAMVLARTPVETPDSEQLYYNLFTKNTNLPFDDVCTPQLSPCPN